MRGYQGSHELKARFTAHVERHRLDDSLLRGTYATEEAELFRGCAVGCSLRSLDEIDGKARPLDKYHGHQELADRLGIPLVLAHLEDQIFEGLPKAEAMVWPTLFARAIGVGADLLLVWPRFAHWLLVDATNGVIRHARTDAQRAAISNVAALFSRQVAGETVPLGEWHTAQANASAYAAAAANVAYAAARAAAAAANVANAAAYAAAAASADASADAADDMKRHFRVMAEALLRFMSEAT